MELQNIHKPEKESQKKIEDNFKLDVNKDTLKQIK